jgi:hypothetical protein
LNRTGSARASQDNRGGDWRMDGKDDDDMDAILSKNDADPGKRKSKSATHKSLITRNLRLAYGEVAGEPVPDRFMELLNQIEDSEDDKS